MKNYFTILLITLTTVAIAQEYATIETGNDEFYKSVNIEVQNVYPNPATSIAIINYNLRAESDAKIVLHDLVGSTTTDFKLNTSEQSLKIDLQNMKEGVYFYTLHVDGENKVTKKLIVKK
ncbi:MAG: T9SS type A sorting domain-containing protein [Cyclobacteriaceae bacterium]